ncbi:hypothetical protein GUITHDRAFT_115923 [Guillardia theta CCMP2712]|uniref:peptidylprolyl isomerase n=1 Tax=Guillardia theta (strain CCMP2712) TaxID=905079 RepID=L1IPF5_GUITC|nr:hypothetical protein GUITHDRAFT_115923 [Guillardia theta CCMP2712]EKX37952.1 hypothetical protein GUITHDRAFT_115923 [Guillardia theta CCMP2712]|eukprot:XP_005824932.1 hypothetical protein GUITHDRAFT_115923 [Guillardia theta CCMP2712]
MLETSVEGITFIVVGCAFMAAVASTDMFDVSTALGKVSDALLGAEDREDEDEDKAAGERRTRVQNPITGRWILKEGSTYNKLVRDGILVEGAGESIDCEPLQLTWTYQELQAGEGIVPREGSAAVLHYSSRLYGRDGPLLSASVLDMKEDEDAPRPFVFEVGDASVIPGLNEAIVTMREGSRGVLVLPPHTHYTSKRKEPKPLTRQGRKILSQFLSRKDPPPVLVMEIHLLGVAAIPPAIMSRDGYVDQQTLQSALYRDSSGHYRLRAETVKEEETSSS